jgi:thiol-disulfide isomerase/thioredoxin
MRAFVFVAILLPLAAGAARPYGAAGFSPPASAAAQAAAAAPAMPRIGQPAPPFAFTEVVAGTGAPGLRAADLTPDRLRGRVVVLDFFATWCAPCVASIPHVNALVEEMRGEPVVFLAVASEPRDVLERMVKDRPMKATLVIDGGERTWRNYWIAGRAAVRRHHRYGGTRLGLHPSVEAVAGDDRRRAPLIPRRRPPQRTTTRTPSSSVSGG